jgi:actin-like ATPase involved in cell morphogenesis
MKKKKQKVEEYLRANGLCIGEKTSERVVLEMTHFKTTESVEVLGRSTTTGEPLAMKVTRELYDSIMAGNQNA